MVECTTFHWCILQFIVHLMSPTVETNRLINFGAGPGQMPHEVLVEVQRELVQYYNTSMSVMEISHRGIDYTIVHNEALQLVREI